MLATLFKTRSKIAENCHGCHLLMTFSFTWTREPSLLLYTLDLRSPEKTSIGVKSGTCGDQFASPLLEIRFWGKIPLTLYSYHGSQIKEHKELQKERTWVLKNLRKGDQHHKKKIERIRDNFLEWNLSINFHLCWFEIIADEVRNDEINKTVPLDFWHWIFESQSVLFLFSSLYYLIKNNSSKTTSLLILLAQGVTDGNRTANFILKKFHSVSQSTYTKCTGFSWIAFGFSLPHMLGILILTTATTK